MNTAIKIFTGALVALLAACAPTQVEPAEPGSQNNPLVIDNTTINGLIASMGSSGIDVPTNKTVYVSVKILPRSLGYDYEILDDMFPEMPYNSIAVGAKTKIKLSGVSFESFEKTSKAQIELIDTTGVRTITKTKPSSEGIRYSYDFEINCLLRVLIPEGETSTVGGHLRRGNSKSLVYIKSSTKDLENLEDLDLEDIEDLKDPESTADPTTPKP